MEESLAELDAIVETFEALLRITQIEAGARKSRFCDVDLGSMLADVADIYEPVAEESGDRLRMRGARRRRRPRSTATASS